MRSLSCARSGASQFLKLPTDDNGDALPLDEAKPIDGVIDEWAHASSDEAIEFATRAARVEGMMVGPSAGAALKVACDIACRPESEGACLPGCHPASCHPDGCQPAACQPAACQPEDASQRSPPDPRRSIARARAPDCMCGARRLQARRSW